MYSAGDPHLIRLATRQERVSWLGEGAIGMGKATDAETTTHSVQHVMHILYMVLTYATTKARHEAKEVRTVHVYMYVHVLSNM